MKKTALFFLLLGLPGHARAGAWTQAEDHWQIIATGLYSTASRSFDHAARPDTPIRFQKDVLQTSTEYGWNDWLTLLFNTETAFARSQEPSAPAQQAMDNAFEGGARLRLAGDIGIVSVQATYKSAGAFNFAISANSNVAGQAAEFRLLYGTSFKFMGDDGFVDVEAGERFLSAPRPNETPVDITAGLWLDADNMAMLQSFNLVGGGNGAPPYASTAATRSRRHGCAGWRTAGWCSWVVSSRHSARTRWWNRDFALPSGRSSERYFTSCSIGISRARLAGAASACR